MFKTWRQKWMGMGLERERETETEEEKTGLRNKRSYAPWGNSSKKRDKKIETRPPPRIYTVDGNGKGGKDKYEGERGWGRKFPEFSMSRLTKLIKLDLLYPPQNTVPISPSGYKLLQHIHALWRHIRGGPKSKPLPNYNKSRIKSY